MNNAPADVILEMLIGGNQVNIEDGSEKWPGKVGHLPDTPDAVVALFDADPLLVARVLATGKTIRRWGVQIRTRSSRYEYNVGWAKLAALDNWLTSRHNVTVEYDGSIYIVNSISCASGPMHIGQDEEKRRDAFTANYLCSIRLSS